jgi:hypothetical protein
MGGVSILKYGGRGGGHPLPPHHSTIIQPNCHIIGLDTGSHVFIVFASGQYLWDMPDGMVP